MEVTDLQVATLAVKIDALQRSVDAMDAKLDAALTMQARHDEQIKDLQDRGKWAGGIFSALLIYVLTKVGLPNM